MNATPSRAPGTVFLVGAGPGDPGLITLRGVECLQQAQVVLYDYLVNPVVVSHAPKTAELICLGHHKSGRTFTPDEITARMLHEAREGRTVVRLKGGDPSIFGRGGDEATALREAGIPFEIVPGITAGLAAAAYTEIPVTHHRDASAVAMVTGRERNGKTASNLDRGLAVFPGTLIYYMGVKQAPRWSRALIEQGKPATTPVAIVRWCSRAQQQTVRCTLGTVADVVDAHEIKPPVVFVVGGVVDRGPDVSWFAARPLFGARVVVPGSPATSERLCARLAALGADVIVRPAIRIADPPDWAPVDAALDRLDRYDWLVFSSANSVDYLVRRLFDRGGDVRRLGAVKLAAMGTGTAGRLAAYHLNVDVVPEYFVAESLAEVLVNQAADRRFLLARASRGRRVLAEQLARHGAHVDEVVVYCSMDADGPDAEVGAALTAGEIDWVTVTSSAAARALARCYGDGLRHAGLVSIGPLTSAALRDEGFEPVAEASPHTTDGLVDAILHVRQTVTDASAGTINRSPINLPVPSG